MDNSIQKIRDACDILSIVSQYVQLKRAGRNYKGLCPFHGEKTPSFMVSPDKQIFHCFGCGKGGDVIKFVQEYERLNFREALEMLAKRAGIELPRSPAKARARDEREQIYAVNAEAARFYVDFLRHPKNGRVGREYLEKRAIRPDTVDRFRLGLAPAGWGELLSHLTAKGFSPEDCERAGLVVRSEKGTLYDRFRGRLIFPILSVSEDVVGFGARVFDDSVPKYINSPESSVFQKGRLLYGLNFARQEILDRKLAVLCEGYMDVIRCHQEGAPYVVASLGTSFTEEHCTLILRYTPNIVMAYDGDRAGRGASMRGSEVFLNRGVRVRVAVFPPVHDPDSFIKTFGPEAFGRLVSDSPDVFDVVLNNVRAEQDLSTDAGRVETARRMIDFLLPVRDEILREVYLDRLSAELSIRKSAIETQLREKQGLAPAPRDRKPAPSAPGEGNRSANPVSSVASSPEVFSPAENDWLRLVLSDEASAPALCAQTKPAWLETETAHLVREWFSSAPEGSGATVAKLLESVSDPARREKLSRLAFENEDIRDRAAFAKQICLKLHIRHMSARYRDLAERIRQTENLSLPGAESSEKLLQLNKELVELKISLCGLEKELRDAVRSSIMQRF